MTPTRRTLALSLLCTALAAAGCGDDDGPQQLASGCALADVSGSTRTARSEYAGAFASFARHIGERGSGRLCLIIAAGDPIAESAPLFAPVGPSEEHRDSPDYAPGEITENVNVARTDFESMMTDPPVSARGSALVEAAVVAADVLAPGDRLTILSDGIQTSETVGDFHDVDLSEAGITALLDRLEQAGLLADLQNVTVEMPLLLYHPGGLNMSAERQAAIRRFWQRWAERAGARLDLSPQPQRIS
ncbi:hypothetical protein DVA67_020330 [Solirubrobacter sp. CPCC 204708]|uniref:VWA domain-containing protein n=1 Tax=Solirubrobacter deserti TaxID=2282478 RepID=A0ABT4RTN9_9ACTN|nr:hypothetical protein [Solirubrobacter deserti]MBE2318340.1 hypothetical protein [Solirubrobacter deserti]MDA0141938.1 hypothetical protein [Solirubrobacter deserti]